VGTGLPGLGLLHPPPWGLCCSAPPGRRWPPPCAAGMLLLRRGDRRGGDEGCLKGVCWGERDAGVKRGNTKINLLALLTDLPDTGINKLRPCDERSPCSIPPALQRGV